MTTSQIKRWKLIGGEQLAQAVFLAVGGECDLLEESYGTETSIWATVTRHLGIVFRDYIDRYWARTAWTQNQQNCQVSFFMNILNPDP